MLRCVPLSPLSGFDSRSLLWQIVETADGRTLEIRVVPPLSSFFPSTPSDCTSGLLKPHPSNRHTDGCGRVSATVKSAPWEYEALSAHSNAEQELRCSGPDSSESNIERKYAHNNQYVYWSLNRLWPECVKFKRQFFLFCVCWMRRRAWAGIAALWGRHQF